MLQKTEQQHEKRGHAEDTMVNEVQLICSFNTAFQTTKNVRHLV